jgi:cysteine desulfurase/selenocysteine lyase
MAKVIEQARRLDPEQLKADFPLLQQQFEGKPLVYLDSAATSQKPRQVLDAERRFYDREYANVHRAVYPLAEVATARYEEARAKLARFVGAPDPESIVFTRGTTESLNLLAHGWGRKVLREGDDVVLTELEHHSNIVPWQFAAQATGAKLKYIPLDDEGQLDLSGLDALITNRTKVVSVSGNSNVLGTMPPLQRLAEAAHSVGAVLAVDGAQLVPHGPVNVADLGIDFLTISGHKMLGPTASGGLFGRLELLEEMDPFFGGGEMIMEVYADRSTFKKAPWKFEAGTMNIAQEVALGAAIEYLESVGMEAIREHERELTAYALKRLGEAGARVFGPTDPDTRGGAISFWYKDIHPHDLAQVLGQEGVCIRAGHHCAQPLMRILGVPATSRASLYLYNTTADVDALVDALDAAERIFGA